jgi:uncharacterized protein YjbJ (UPF0337 family)
MASGLWDQIKGSWKQLRGEVKQEWGDLTDDDLTYIEGSADKLIGKVQERYGIAKQEAEMKVNEWANRLDMKRYNTETPDNTTGRSM